MLYSRNKYIVLLFLSRCRRDEVLFEKRVINFAEKNLRSLHDRVSRTQDFDPGNFFNVQIRNWETLNH